MVGCCRIFVLLLVVLTTAISCSEEPNSSRPTHGARIAEPETGAWVWLCAVSVHGAAYSESKAEGTAQGPTRETARTAAVRAGCAKAKGGKHCVNATAGWTLGSAMCAQKKKIKPVQFECTIEVSRPAGAPEATDQAEAPTAKRACRRAKREACRKVGGSDACIRGIDGWYSNKSLGRRRQS